MSAHDIRKRFLTFFQKQNHIIIPSAPLVPENDPTTLFTSSGMQPLVPYLLGQPHPLGKRLADSQKSFRSQDIEEVGDTSHMTFFEMLGNWSLGDFFKKEQLPWIFEFLTKELGLDPEKLFVTVFEGNSSVPKDEESIKIWKEIFSGVGIDAKLNERIFLYSAAKNWWSRSGEPSDMPAGEPGGPDSEVFYDFGIERGLHEKSRYRSEQCHPNCQCGRFMEIGNSVFMQYQKQGDGSLKELPQKNVDFGGGLERLNAAVQNQPDVFLTDSFQSIICLIEQLSAKKYGKQKEETKAMRVIADHIRGAVMMTGDGVFPSNKAQGYVLRRLIRRALLYGKSLGIWGTWESVGDLVMPVTKMYEEAYPDVGKQKETIRKTLVDEAIKFGKTLDKGLKEIEKMKDVDGKKAFMLYETYGFPWEMTEEIVLSRGQKVDRKQFEDEFKKHQEHSRSSATGMFKGGLANNERKTTQYHTTTHLLHQALRTVLGNHVSQKGSNITAERLRFDFSHPAKLAQGEIKRIEDIVNEQIRKNLPVTVKELDKDDALRSGALGFFVERYGDRVKVYSIGDYSREICGGPHVRFTGELGHFTIIKEESAASGIRRIYGKLDGHEIV